MLSEYIKNIFNRQSFVIFIVLSALIHLGLIASSSKIKDLILPDIRQSIKVDNLVETTIEFVLNEDTYNKKYLVKDKALDIIEEIANDDAELEKKKRQLFVDSSQLKTDEESQIETDKIGEKGSIARDKKANNSDVSEESFSQGEWELLSLEKGAYAFAPDINKVYLPDYSLKKEDVSEIDNQQTLESLQLDVEKEFNTQKEIENKNIENENNDEEVLNTNGEKNNLRTSGKIASVTKYQHEKLRTLNSEFERVIPIPVDPELPKNNQQLENDNPGTIQGEDIKESEEKRDLSNLTKKEREKIIKEIFELYDEDINGRKKEHKQKPKVLMSVNGKGTYNVPAPSFKADLSNATLHGEPSFNIKKHEYASYYKHIRDKISIYWLLYFGTDQSIKLETNDGHPIIVDFKVRPSGKITDVSIAEDAGNPFLASRTEVSVSNTQLDMFPPFIKEKFIDVRFNFYFF